MQSKIRPVFDPTYTRRWHYWFAWYPVKAFVSPEYVWEANKANKTLLHPPYRWVWLTYIERKYDEEGYVPGWWQRRVTEKTR